MATWDNHPARDRAKFLVVGDSGAGKSGLFASVANAGFKTFIIDFEDGLDVIGAYLTDEGKKNLWYVTLKDRDGERAFAFRQARNILRGNWIKEDGAMPPLNKWDGSYVLGIDSITAMGEAAINEAVAVNEAALRAKTSGSARQEGLNQVTMAEYGEAQREVRHVMNHLLSPAIPCNVICTARPILVDDDRGVSRIYPSLVSKNYSAQHAAAFFNTVVGLSSRRDGSKVIRTVGNNQQEFKTARPNLFPPEMDADYAAILRTLVS